MALYNFLKTPAENAMKGNNAGYNTSNIQNALYGNSASMAKDPLMNIKNAFTNNANNTYKPITPQTVTSSEPKTQTYDVKNITGVPNTVQDTKPAQPTSNTSSTANNIQPVTNPLQSEVDRLKTSITGLQSQYNSDVAAKDSAYNAMLEAKRAAVRAAVQKAQGKLQTQIDNAPQQFQDQRNTVAVNQSQNLQNIRRSLANLGYNPDSYVTREEMQNVNVGAQGQINQLDIAQQKLIQDAKNSISELEEQGNIEDANAVAEITNQKMQTLDALRNNYMSQSDRYNSDIANNIYKLMEYNRNASNDESDQLYKNAVIDENRRKNELDAYNEATKNEYNFTTEQAKNKLASDKAKWESLGYMMPDWANKEIPEDIKKQLLQYSDNYAQFAKDNPNSPLSEWARIASIQKMFDNPALLQQYGQQYATPDMRKYLSDIADKDRNYGLNVDKFNYGIGKDDRDFVYNQMRDSVKDDQWSNEFGLKEWSAKDASARGWDNNSISRQAQQDASARGWANIEVTKGKIADSQASEAEKDIDAYIKNYFTSDEMVDVTENREGLQTTRKVKSGKKSISDTDRNNIKIYLDDLDLMEVPYSIIKSLKAKYNIKD
jgi:hypothetical protein